MATAIFTKAKVYANPVVRGIEDIQEGEVAFVEDNGDLDFIERPILSGATKVTGLNNVLTLKVYSPFKLSPTAEGAVSCRIFKNGTVFTPTVGISGMNINGDFLDQTYIEDDISTFSTLLNPYEYLESSSTPTDEWRLEFLVSNAYGLKSAAFRTGTFKNIYTFTRQTGLLLSGSETIPSATSFVVSAGEFLASETTALGEYAPPGSAGYHWRLESSVWIKSANVQNIVDSTYYTTATDRTEMDAGKWSPRHIFRSVFGETCFWVYGGQYDTQAEAEAEVMPDTTDMPNDIKRGIYVGKAVVQKNTDNLNAARSFISNFV